MESMLEKRLLILLPFCMFIVEHSLKEYEENEEKRQELVEALKDIMQGLARMQDAGEIDVLTQRSLIELTDKVNYHLARKYGTVQKEAKKIMDW